MIYQVWYMKPSFFIEGAGGRIPDARNLSETHVHLKDVETARGIEAVFCEMQGEVWSPSGEARALIEKKGLQHTSMCVGDVIVDDVGNAHVVAKQGYVGIGGVPHTTKERKFALLSRQGTACAETVLTAREFTDKNKKLVEERARSNDYAVDDRPVPNSWTDVTNNDAC